MSTNIKKMLVIAATTLVAGSAMAADGSINFTGSITAASCNVSGGSGTNVTGNKGNQIIDVGLGKVAIDSLGGGAGGNVVGGTAINLSLNCGASATDLKTVSLRFDPVGGSGVDAFNNHLLATTGPDGDKAKGVGIGVYNNEGKLINLSGNEMITGKLEKGGTDDVPVYTANLAMRAAYVTNGDKEIKAGQANGTLPFTLNYE